MPCQIQQRNTIRRAAEAIGACEHVVATDVLTPDAAPRGVWTLEFVCDSGARGVPPAVLQELATAGLSVRGVDPRGEPPHYIVAAVPR